MSAGGAALDVDVTYKQTDFIATSDKGSSVRAFIQSHKPWNHY